MTPHIKANRQSRSGLTTGSEMIFIRTALRESEKEAMVVVVVVGGEGGVTGPHSSALSPQPSQQHMKQVFVFTRGHREQDKCCPHMVQTGHIWPHADPSPTWVAKDFIKSSLSSTRLPPPLPGPFNTDSACSLNDLDSRMFISRVLINVRTFMSPAWNLGPLMRSINKHLHLCNQPLALRLPLWFIVTSPVRGVASINSQSHCPQTPNTASVSVIWPGTEKQY